MSNCPGSGGEPTTREPTEISSGTGRTAPDPPDPATFGIDPHYFDRAVEGARQWQKRQHLLPEPIRWGARGLAVLAGIGIGVTLAGKHHQANALVVVPYLSLLAVSVLIEIAEARYDARLKRDFFNPKFNPQPDAYKRYAQDLAEFEREVTTVYVSKNWLWHSTKYCSGMLHYYETPKWKVQLIRPCSKCGSIYVPLKELPHPFGNGSVPNHKSQDLE